MSFGRQIIGGSLIVALSGAVARILSIVTVPILSPILGPEPYGVAALVGTTVAIATMLALLGIDMGYARYFLTGEKSEQDSVESFCWRFALFGSVLMALITGAGWALLGERWSSNHNSLAIYAMLAVTLSACTTMAMTRVRLQGNYKLVGVSILLGAALSATVSITLALFWRQDVWPLLIGGAIASLTTALILGVPGWRQLKSSSSLTPNRRKEVVSLGIAGSVTAPMYWLISSADRWFIGTYSGVAIVGIYSMAASVALPDDAVRVS